MLLKCSTPHQTIMECHNATTPSKWELKMHNNTQDSIRPNRPCAIHKDDIQN